MPTIMWAQRRIRLSHSTTKAASMRCHVAPGLKRRPGRELRFPAAKLAILMPRIQWHCGSVTAELGSPDHHVMHLVRTVGKAQMPLVHVHLGERCPMRDAGGAV